MTMGSGFNQQQRQKSRCSLIDSSRILSVAILAPRLLDSAQNEVPGDQWDSESACY